MIGTPEAVFHEDSSRSIATRSQSPEISVGVSSEPAGATNMDVLLPIRQPISCRRAGIEGEGSLKLSASAFRPTGDV